MSLTHRAGPARTAAAGAAVLVLAGLAGCAEEGSSDGDGGAGTGAIAVEATDESCEVAELDLPAGTHTFTVTNGGTKVTEFYVYAPGDRVMGEVENIVPSLTRELRVELPAGTYETACKPGMSGDGIRSELTVTGEAVPLADDEQLAGAVEGYQRYVTSQAAALVETTTEFVAAVKAGDVETAKALFAPTRTYYERIEPIAESFGDLDPQIDAREGDTEPGVEWTGFHRIEKSLWVDGDIAAMAPVADKLLADVTELQRLVQEETVDPLDLANGAKELLDEVATSKVTGEEDRYSHTDLWDFMANLEGSQTAVAQLRPVIDEREPELGTELDRRFQEVQTALEQHRVGDGWKTYTELTPDDVKQLSDVINGLAEPISQVAVVVAGEGTGN